MSHESNFAGEPSPAPARGLPFTRRGFLLRTGAAGAWIGAASALSGCRRMLDVVAPPAVSSAPGTYLPQRLPAAEYATLVAVSRRLIPSGQAHPGADVLGVAARIDRELGFHDTKLSDDVRDALRVVEWWPLLTHFARFTSLSPEAQDDVLGAMIESRFAVRRSAFGGLKFLVMFLHYTQDAAWVGTGYDGPWVPRVRPAQLA